jgi:glycerol-3-phosphate cytidylyltransferase
MKRVITYGTFDLLHYGHINLLRRARNEGDYLVVALSTDEFTFNKKEAHCYFSWEQRKMFLEAVRYVDLVIPESSWTQKPEDIRHYHIDVFVIGEDWSGEFDYLEDQCEVVYLARTPEVSTTRIKEDLKMA